MSQRLYPTEPLKCWGKAKELRLKYYKNYAEAHEKGGIRWAGGGWSFDAVPDGLGEDVYPLTGEPYGASISVNLEFSKKCLEAAEAAGYARDLCSYFRNYIGSLICNEYAFGGKYPKPDFLWQGHICCTHGKWYQQVSRLEGGIPLYVVDVCVGPPPPFGKLTRSKIEYVSGQLLDGIEWLEKVTGRKFDDEKFLNAVKYTIKSTHTWAKICFLNQTIPAPLDEKTMFSLFVLLILHKASKEFADFYEELYEEVRDRVARGIAAIENEQCRLLTDSQPPWYFLKMWRYLENNYGAVPIGSLYTFAIDGMFELKEGNFLPKEIPNKWPETREEACNLLAEWNLYRPQWAHFYGFNYKSTLMIAIAKQWKVNGVILHYNRGCEGSSLGVPTNRLDLLKAGFPVVSFEGSMGDERDIDETRTIERIDAFMELLGIKKIKA